MINNGMAPFNKYLVRCHWESPDWTICHLGPSDRGFLSETLTELYYICYKKLLYRLGYECGFNMIVHQLLSADQ